MHLLPSAPSSAHNLQLASVPLLMAEGYMTTLTAIQTSATTWTIDPAHSIAAFKAKHM
jgi:polyisoprenoid-binding protein YceI